MRRLSRVSAAVLTLFACGCIDLVDPDVLELRRPYRVDMAIQVVSADEQIECGSLPGFPPATEPVQAADGTPATTLCLRGFIEPGRDRLALPHFVRDARVQLLRRVVEPASAADTLLTYLHESPIATELLTELPLVLELPTPEGLDVPVRRTTWPLISPPAVLTTEGDADGGFTFRTDPPPNDGQPPPFSSTWSLAIAGDSGSVAIQGRGVPRARYDVPAPVLTGIGEPRSATLRWTRRLLEQRDGEFLIDVFVVQQIRWRLDGSTETASAASCGPALPCIAPPS